MGFRDSIADDLSMMDDVVTIMLTKIDQSGEAVVETDYEVEASLQYELTAQEVIDSDGVFEQGDNVFEVRQMELGAVEPEEGDRVTDEDGTTWLVVRSNLDVWKTIWRLTCRKETGQ